MSNDFKNNKNFKSNNIPVPLPPNLNLPSNLEAENAILGAILLNNNLVDQAIEDLNAEDFHSYNNQIIFSAMVDIFSRNEPIDIILLSDELNKKKLLDSIGGIAYLASLLDNGMRMENIKSYTKIVKGKSKSKRVILKTNNFLNRSIEDDTNIDNYILEFSNELSSIYKEGKKDGFVPISELVYDEVAKIDKFLSDPHHVSKYLSTGFRDLDVIIGGLGLKELVTIASRNGHGKTALGLNLAYNVAAINDVGVGIFSLEMPGGDITLRILCSQSQINSNKIRNKDFSQDDWHRLNDNMPRVEKLKIFVEDQPGTTLEEIKIKTRKLKDEYDIKLLLIDYVQLIKVKSISGKTRAQELTDITKELKDLAKELEICIIELAQINRNPEGRTDESKRPKVSDIKESGGIEDNSDIIMLIFREEMYSNKPEHKNLAEIIVGKNRGGPIEAARVAYIKELTRFENLYLEK